ncbi:alpha/beta hydrolase [Brevundimonas lenta]|uniref:Serine aminopeptidase S33 domain-containing protein n=1 Tax=Brevundimonas lenta TaxID=424796 RepID=A0A7W6JC59_9CAUL|nr:alpha/beta fold hydrolase [Brevundimonas lenta]MBB4082404.1 hypothetical protein [Brevundimonas lenta]
MLSLILAAALAGPIETPVTVPSEPAGLHGTLLAPEGETRAVAVIIAGSGPTDRNGNAAALGLSSNSYRLLAEGLAAHGVATVRYDKRGVGESAGAAVREEDLRFDTYVNDARAWAGATAARTGQDCVWLIGHSEGAQIAVKAAETRRDGICGLILLSGLGQPASAGLRLQLEAAPMPEALREQALTALAELSAGRPTTSPAGLESLFRPSVQPYLISWLPLDPAAAIRGWRGPVFIGQGSTDIQTSVADAEALAAAQPNAKLVIWDGVNHLLKIAPADRTANAATYADPTLPLAPGVVDDVAGFILQAR